MYIVVLSGGSGKRLWPLSNSLRSKQYIKLLNDENATQCSMVQRIYHQLNKAGLDNQSIICASQMQVEILESQLGKVNIAIEPSKRDTFPAIILSCVYLKDKLGAEDDDTVCVIPVDPYTDESYFETIKSLPEVLEKSEAEIALMGVKPNYPSEKFGYIVPKQSMEGYTYVDYFVEKPDFTLARELIEKNALWNCGVFCVHIGEILKYGLKYVPEVSYEYIFKNYDQFPKISFDYEVIEKMQRLAVVEFAGKWKDLGTWNSLTEEMATTTVGNVLADSSCKNSYAVNELDIPVVIMGVDDVVVVASFDGILVSDKKESVRVKEVVEPYNYEPMYEERRWGTIKVIDKVKKGQLWNTTRKINIFKGCNSSYHYHEQRDEIWTFIRGNAEIIVDGIRQLMGAGEVLRIPRGTKHAVRAISELEFIEIQFGYTIADDDLHRETLNWNEIIYK